MPLRLWFIILVLATADLFLGMKAVQVWSDVERTPPDVEGKTAPVSVEKGRAQRTIPPETDYEVVVESNLFQPNRSEPVGEKAPDDPGKKASTPDDRVVKLLQETIKRISVYGIMMVNEEKRALIKRPATPLLGKPGNRRPGPRPGEETQWVRVGDTVDRFTVNEILPTGVVLGAEGLVFNVVLYDKDNPKERLPEKATPGPVLIDTQKGPEAEQAPQKVEAPKEESPEKKLPVKPEKRPPDSPVVQVLDDPEKR